MTHHQEGLAPRKRMIEKEYTCIVCNSNFKSRSNGNPPQYCDLKCYNKRRQELYKKNYVPVAKTLEHRQCELCNSTFQPLTNSARFCKIQECVAIRRLEKSRRQEIKRRGPSTETRRNSDLKSRYGITLEEWNKILNKYDHACGICKRKDVELFVAHCHSTGKVRGPLCHLHNAGIGMFSDDIELLKKAIEYLEQTKLG